MIQYHRKNLGVSGLLLLALASLLGPAGCAAPREASEARPPRAQGAVGKKEPLPTVASWCSPICDNVAVPPDSELYRILRRLNLLG